MKSWAIVGVAAAILVGSCLSPSRAQEVAGAASVTGAGSTFAFPIVSRWAKGYQQWVAGGGAFPIAGAGLDDPPTAPLLDYEPSGSLAGTMRIKHGAVDFGASDVPLNPRDLQMLGLIQFPLVIGGVVAVVNIDGIGPGELRLTGPLLADIYLGKIVSWSDPAIKALNPDLKLPDAKIAPIHRSDGSGTTYNFTNYLTKTSPQWREKLGFDLLIKWPTGTGARGNSGVAQAVARTKNAIGYVEFAQARLSRLSYALIQNQAGSFVNPDPASFRAAAANAAWDKTGDFDLLLTDTAGEAAYPIVATVFVLMQRSTAPGRARAALNFFEWSLDKGAKDAADIGYVPLPDALVTQIKAYWAQTLKIKA